MVTFALWCAKMCENARTQNSKRVWPWTVAADIIKAAVMELEQYNKEADAQQ